MQSPMNLSIHKMEFKTDKSECYLKISPGLKASNVKKPPATQKLSNEIKVKLDFKSEDSCLLLDSQIDRWRSSPQNNLDTYSILLSNFRYTDENMGNNNLHTDMHKQHETNVSPQRQNDAINELSLTDVELIVQEWKSREGF